MQIINSRDSASQKIQVVDKSANVTNQHINSPVLVTKGRQKTLTITKSRNKKFTQR